jgi:hypothetical protein
MAVTASLVVTDKQVSVLPAYNVGKPACGFVNFCSDEPGSVRWIGMQDRPRSTIGIPQMFNTSDTQCRRTCLKLVESWSGFSPSGFTHDAVTCHDNDYSMALGCKSSQGSTSQ